MKFVRPLALSVVCAGALGLLAGCSGKPENSPAIRKKFAEIDSMNGNVEQLLADVKSLNDEVSRLKQENSELRAFLPGVDGQGAIDKISTLETRLQEMERNRQSAPAAPRTAPAAPATPASTSGGQVALEEAPLAAAAAPRVVANQQAAPAPAAPRGFKELTNRSTAAAAPAPRAAAPAAAPKAAAPKPAATKPAASRGSYHVIAPGETIVSIAAKHGIPAERLQQAVGLPPGARLTPGQRIFVPGK